MMDGFMDRLMKNAASAYMPKLEAIRRARRAELEEMKAEIRTDPDQVRAWFDKEIEKLDEMDVSRTLSKGFI
jgi:hypothetical protein